MFRIERQQEILNYVNEHQTAKNQEMARLLSYVPGNDPQ